ncbi:NAD-dependent epimerase/dehydratase family protein [Chryseobacterium sp. PMSZPI]|uniref:NAD-dependent epimerase/dehydratase family protein n=1 Tax=Chryseobacterium sp. PMSZPI TaxID=1033900 RepID=UPI000C344844|nr:NAD-dependent epimerase/dehydratase family protein [Chryseobacterium sp. PMSZPI]PKF74313.1 epimerase [Chryseobacterium sp. PMSZPI]
MKIAIFGSTGFVGTHLKQNLINKYEIISYSLRDDRDNLQYIKDCAIMINLVGKAHDHKGIATEADYHYANVDLAKTIFEKFVSSKANLLIHVSSLAALEELESSDFLTEADIPNPISSYGKSKRAAEEWLLAQKISPDKKIIIIRPPMIHGSGDKGNLSLLVKLISKGLPYPLASFDNKRSFICIDNFCFFIEKTIENYHNLNTGIYHISDDQALSTKSVISIIQKEYGKRTFSLSVPRFLMIGIARIGDFLPILINSTKLKKMTSDLLVSNLKIKKELDIHTLPYTAEDGLRKTIRSFIDKK